MGHRQHKDRFSLNAVMEQVVNGLFTRKHQHLALNCKSATSHLFKNTLVNFFRVIPLTRNMSTLALTLGLQDHQFRPYRER